MEDPRRREELERRQDQALRRMQQLARSDDVEGWEEARTEYERARAEAEQLGREQTLEQEQDESQNQGQGTDPNLQNLDQRRLGEIQDQALREMQRLSMSRGPGDDDAAWDAANRAYQQARRQEIELLRQQGRLAQDVDQDQGQHR